MDSLQTLFAFIVAIGLLVAIHEFGHFWVARKMAVKVVRFSIGFGPIVWRYQKNTNSTEYALSAIPLGGYVKMVDEREGEVSAADLPYAFTQKSLWARAAIVAAGPVFNLILAVLIYWGGFMSGETGTRPLIGTPTEHSLMAQAGFHAGEEILTINHIVTPTWKIALETLSTSLIGAEQGLTVVVKTETGNTLTRTLTIPLAISQNHEMLFQALGLKAWQPTIVPIVGRVIENSIAQRAGLQVGDHILRANGTELTDWGDWVKYIQSHAGQEISVVIARNQQTHTLLITPEAVINEGKVMGKIGVGVHIPAGLFERLQVNYRLAPLPALNAALARTAHYSMATLKMMGAMFIGNASVKNLSGPVSIAKYAGQSAEQGLDAFLKFLAIVSISLGVLNLLPIPVLDGGHLFMFAIEAIKGSPVADTLQILFQKIGMTALFALMILAISVDIGRLFS